MNNPKAQNDVYSISDVLEARIVLDFSRTASGLSGAGLTVTLAGVKSNLHAPDLTANVNAGLESVTFGQLSATNSGYEALHGTVSYEVSIGGTSSKWEERHMALVLTPTTPLPADAWLEPVAETHSARYEANAEGKFVVPLGAVGGGRIMVKLCSNLLPTEAKDYSFDVAWYVSDSLADAAPLNGKYTEKSTTLTLSKPADAKPAFSINGDAVVNDGILKVELQYANVADTTIEMMVEWRDDDGAYHSSGQSWTYKPTEKDSDEQEISVATNRPGNYRVRVSVLKNNTLLLETAHYFIITANTGNSPPTTGGNNTPSEGTSA